MEQRVIRPTLDNKLRPEMKAWDQLLAQTGLSYREGAPQINDLVWCPDRQVLGLYRSQNKGALFLDLGAQYQRLISQSDLHKKRGQQPFFRAIGGAYFKNGLIWDASVGTGRDFCQLLAYGATRLWAFERNPVVYALFYFELEKLKKQLYQDKREVELKLFFEDVGTSLPEKERPDVIYYDPMYPEKKKNKALARQWMELFKDIVGQDGDEQECLERLIQKTQKRVVVKRALKAKTLLKKPHAQFAGKTTRYDLYCP